jgi:hypothetical protein
MSEEFVEAPMPEQEVTDRARRDKEEGKSPSTQAGEFVHEEIEHVREGKHGARSAKQAIAIGLSKARRAGIKLPPPKSGTSSARTRKQAQRDTAKGRHPGKAPSRKRSRSTENALRKESTKSVSHTALSAQARSSARRRGHTSFSKAARRAVKTKSSKGRRQAGRRAVRTRRATRR